MNNPVLYYGLGGLLIVFFLVMIYFFTKTWRWFHVVCVVLVFFSSLFLLRIVAATYRTLDVWRTQVVQSSAQIEKLQAESELLRVGRMDDTEQVVESVRLLRAKVKRITMDEGRVWRHCTPQSRSDTDNSVVLSTVPPAPATPEGAAEAAAPAAPPNLIQEQTVLHAFLEDVAPAGTGATEGEKVPHYYVGEFVAVAATNTTVTVRPLKPLSQFDQLRIRENQTWVLYETIPADGHEWFTADPDAKANWNVPANDSPAFGKIDENVVQAMLNWPRFVPQAFPTQNVEYQWAMERLNAVVQQYLRDGKGVTNKDEFDPFEVWTKVRFLKPKSEPVDSGAKVSPIAAGVTDDYFDQAGLAEVEFLQMGGEVQFKEGDVAIFPQAAAQQLIDEGFCRFEENLYVRPLNDYAYLFRDFDEQLDLVAFNTQKILRDIGELENAQKNIALQITVANDDQTKLKQDVDKTQDESTKITEYASVLDKHWTDTQAQLTQLFRTNIQLHDELERRYQELTEAINRAVPAAKN